MVNKREKGSHVCLQAYIRELRVDEEGKGRLVVK